MRYLKNNGEPTRITINQQIKVGYLNKKGDRKEIRVIMWRDEINEAVENNDARDMALAKDKKAVMRYQLKPDRTSADGWARIPSEDVTEIRPFGWTQDILNYPHILNFGCGTSARDMRKYDIKVGEIKEIENGDDAEAILKAYHFVDELDSKQELVEVISQAYGHKGEKTTGNPYRSFPSPRADVSRAPLNFVDVPESEAPRVSSIEDRVTEITKAEEAF